MKEKKNKKLITIIIILALCLFGSMSYIIYDKVLIQEQKEEKEKNTLEQEEKPDNNVRDLNEIEKEQILSQIKDYTTSLATSYPIDNEHPLANQSALNFTLVKIGTLRENILESEIEQILQTYFGKNHPYKHENINCLANDGVLYQYDSTKREYTFQNTHGHSGPGSAQSEIYYVTGTVENNKYIVNVHILYGNYCGDICGPTINYYKTIEDSMNGENAILGPYNDSHTITDEEYKKISSTIPTTTFTLEKDIEGNYGLKSVIIR